MRYKLYLLFLGIIVLAVGLVGGCGMNANTGAYNDYYYPDWTPDGKIICVKQVSAWEETGSWPAGGSSRRITSEKYYIVTMDEDGGNETIIKQINGVGKVAASPLGNYIAYADNNYLRVIATSGADVFAIDCEMSGYDYDWSNDGNKLIYNIYDYTNGANNYRTYLINYDGTNKTLIANKASSPAWRYGDKIIISKPLTTEAIRIVTINSDTFEENTVYPKVIGGEFNVSPVNNNEVIFRSYGIEKFSLSSPEAEPILLINRNDIWNIHLSPDGTKIIGNGTGSGTDFGSEILKINIDGSGLIKIK